MAAALLALLLAACSGSRIGYGVVLWSNAQGNLNDGQIVTVKSESKINNSYEIQISGAKGTIEIPTWRVKLFKSEKDAVNFSLSYQPYVALYAKATTNGAPIRDQPNANAQRSYRMREGQVIKVISKEASPAEVAGETGYWYQVLTEDGTLGYSFSSDLTLYNPGAQAQQQASVGQKLLDTVLSTTYRPQYFQQMIDSNRIDLAKFSRAFGFFVDQTSKTVRIVMPGYSLGYAYSQIKDLGNNDFVFDGTPVQMTIQSPDQIRLQYSDKAGNQYDQTFIRVTQDVGLLVEQERNRRLEIFGRFLEKEPYTSDYYGRIDLTPDMGFTWTGYSRLVPDIIPSGSGTTGVVDFPLSLGDPLKGTYDGVISFYFGATPSSTSTAGAASASGGPKNAPVSNGSSSTALAATGANPPGRQLPNLGSTPGFNLSTASPAPSAGSSVPLPRVPSGTRVSFLYTMSSSGVRLTYVPDNTVSDNVVNRVSSTPIIIFFSFKTQSS